MSGWGSISLVSTDHILTLMCCSVRMLKQRCALGCVRWSCSWCPVSGTPFQASLVLPSSSFFFWLYPSTLLCCPFCSTFLRSASAQITVGTACATAGLWYQSRNRNTHMYSGDILKKSSFFQSVCFIHYKKESDLVLLALK